MTRDLNGLYDYRLSLPLELRAAARDPEPVPAPIRFNATVVDHWDGDSFYVEAAVGLHGLFFRRQLVRILGAAAREKSDPGGLEAKYALQTRPGMTIGSPVVLTAMKDDKYGGRIDVVVSYLVAGKARDLASDLIAEQWAVPWNGVGVQPKPPWPRTVT